MEKEWLWGKHAVEAAVINPRRKISRLFLAESHREKYMREWSHIKNCTFLSSWRDILPEDAVHQGMAALVTPLEEVSFAQTSLQPTGIFVVLDHITDPHNVGAIWRASAVFGAQAVVITHHHSPPMGGVLAKSASGALEHVPCVRVSNIAQFLDAFKKRGGFVIGLWEKGDISAECAAQKYHDVPIALVLGAEGKGLRRLTKENCDDLASITTTPTFSVLNVSTACAIMLHSLYVARQRG